jgi:mannan endo-1,4-beta-mannosidase
MVDDSHCFRRSGYDGHKDNFITELTNNNFYRSVFILLLLLWNGCEKSDSPIEEQEFPVLLSSEPAANTVVPVATQSINLTFKGKIILIERIKITLNGEIVPAASASENILTISFNRLYEKTTYTLTIGAGAIKAQPGNLNPEPFTVAFTTDALPPVEITPHLVVPDPSPEAVDLYDFLKANFGKKIISGTVANVAWNINEAEWVHQHTGKYPALNVFDYIFLYASPANGWIDYGDTKVVEDWWNAGGIVGCMWHWNVPQTGKSDQYSFYTSETSFDVSKAVQEGTAENAVVKADLEKISNYLLLLKRKNIPVIWRPLHEAAGRWFWWGAKGPEPCKALWKIMFDHFKAKGLNNLIWVWTSEPDDDAWYPGDEYVDIIGRDVYDKKGANDLFLEYNSLKQRFPNKIITLSECGNVAGIGDQINAGANWSWFMTWYDYDRTVDPGSSAFQSEAHRHGDAGFWRSVFATGKALSREDMGALLRTE